MKSQDYIDGYCDGVAAWQRYVDLVEREISVYRAENRALFQRVLDLESQVNDYELALASISGAGNVAGSPAAGGAASSPRFGRRRCRERRRRFS